MSSSKQTRRQFLKQLGIVAVSLAASKNILSCAKPQKQNFVFILVDDLGWTDLGCYGSTFYETPNIDQLAAEGMMFTDAYAACPVCSPTRASIMAGKYPARMNTTDWFGAPQPETAKNHWTRNKPLLPAPYIEHLPLEEVTVAETLQQNGYATFFAGKWHLGREGFYPENQGFDFNKGGWERGGPYGRGKYFTPYDNPRLSDGPEGEHLPDRLARETCRFIEAHKGKPFLAYLSFYSVHTPLMSREDLKKKYQKKAEGLKNEGSRWGQEEKRKWRLVQDHAVYAGMVEAMDQAVGKVLEKLKSLKLDQNTVVFFMSDNGGLSTSEGHPTTNLPLRAGKGWLYEGGIREPMVIKWQGITAKGSTCRVPVTSPDFYPTMLEIAELPLKPKQHKDGVSLIPLLKGGNTLNRETLFWHYPHYGNQGGSPGAAIREGDFKLIEFFEDNHVELYNLKNDIGERNNLASTMPEKVREMLGKLHHWQKEVDAGMVTPNPAYR